MKWKDTGEMPEKEEKPKEEYYDEEHFSPWSARNNPAAGGLLKRLPIFLILLVVAIVTSVVALLSLFSGRGGEPASQQQIALLQQNVRQIEERLERYEAIDEKVSRIWEQAQSFERFKERYDRGEASMTLRMDHLTMSLENLQKQLAEARKAPAPPVAAASADTTKKAAAEPPAPAATDEGKTQYHTVVSGDTLFSIGQRYGLKVDQLRNLNRLGENAILQPGQRLIVSP
ncbi:LysM peptidoglycan-binding domain-containing protein [Desulfatitalea alkaliphila]|uniref:LysM peptidoglycan-binding domain-containing protein n=1 Tax=Desulfatitalea alkaliphila TaxID=2929485 RepID=A0AA41R5Z4_9BACT|nr:LysM domain-containing protein [Desulfatitalea alkaliphila]MCJ8501725.1 LysM peptidoglycan-binding domain-containing protein [Desulfatitalea alkaliphila]